MSAFIRRILFNTSSIYIKQLKKTKIIVKLQPVYGLALLGHDFRLDDANWIHHYNQQFSLFHSVAIALR